jgi:hypothetical protein
MRVLRLQAEAAATKIGQFIKEMESQIGWTTQLPWSAGTLDQRRFDGLRLLRQVPAITTISQLDASGKEQLFVSRLAKDMVGSGTDYSQDPKFTEAVAHRVYYGPVYLRRQSDPYMTLSLAGTGRDAGVSVAEIALKLVWDVVSQIKVGDLADAAGWALSARIHGQAYILDGQGRVIAHPDVSLVQAQRDFSALAQVRQARRRDNNGFEVPLPVQPVQDINGRDVLVDYSPVAPLDWMLFVEVPVEEADTLSATSPRHLAPY